MARACALCTEYTRQGKPTPCEICQRDLVVAEVIAEQGSALGRVPTRQETLLDPRVLAVNLIVHAGRARISAWWSSLMKVQGK